MHSSVMDFLRANLSQAEVLAARVLEVGSRNVNGSPREVVMPLGPLEYIGVDAEAGEGVDRMLDAADLVKAFGVESFDVVISTEMLEHADDWRTAVDQMKAVLNANGLLIVTARSPGFPFHEYPGDFWRFTVDGFRAIFADMQIEVLTADPSAEHPGVFLKVRVSNGTGRIDLSAINVARVER